jgi:hypothetical protein
VFTCEIKHGAQLFLVEIRFCNTTRLAFDGQSRQIVYD